MDCKYNSDNNKKFVYINPLKWCPRCLIGKILCTALKIDLFVCTSHLVWRSQPSITTTLIIHGRSKARLKTGYGIVLAKPWDQYCKRLYRVYINHLQQRSQSLARIISYPCLQSSLGSTMICCEWGPATPDRMTGMYKEVDFKCRA